ncbi:MAG: chemotaxis response regulator protein-glutamate methylesterase [Rhodocyclaceae bacterium]|nr:chemotaxis response regulator protein-glutamate methylesterase [Rhodocyclaceae bacterium]
MTISVLLVDDSAVARQVISQAIATAPDIRVLTTAANPIVALEKMKDEWPNVIVLDIDMPRMDGITFLKKLMLEHPTPVIICSALSDSTAKKVTLEAMSAGAVAVVPKPMSSGRLQIKELSQQLIVAIQEAARTSYINQYRRPTSPPLAPPRTRAESGDSTATALANAMQERQTAPKLTADAMLPAPKGTTAQAIMKTAQRIVTIGISTGGTQALERLLPRLPLSCPGIAIVQHMPETLTGAFAKRLDELSKISVREAKDGDQMQPGLALISPGGKHLLVRRSGVSYFVEVREGPLVNRHRPSVDVLFRSAAVSAGINATGIIMTGMGDDGALGLREMFDCGAHTIAQDEASCTVFGMPKEAIKLGGARETLSLEMIAQKIGAMAAG